MILTGDYHTHSVYSHGKGQVIENANSAKNIGLKEIAISDHGFAHSVFGISKKKLPSLRLDCDSATTKTGVKVKVGIESNIIGVDGAVDLPSSLYDSFDVFLAGIHKLVLFKVNSYFPLGIPNLINATLKREKVSKRLQRSNTKAYVNAIKLNPIDVITHLNFCAFADALEVAKVASDYGTYLELNAKKEHLTDQELCDIVAKTNVQFVIGSDAHTPDRVGEIELVRKKIERVNLPLDRIANIDGRLPNFRFKAFKEGK